MSSARCARSARANHLPRGRRAPPGIFTSWSRNFQPTEHRSVPGNAMEENPPGVPPMAKAQETTLVSSDFSDEEIVASGVRSRRRKKAKVRSRPAREPRPCISLGALPLGLGFVGGALGWRDERRRAARRPADYAFGHHASLDPSHRRRRGGGVCHRGVLAALRSVLRSIHHASH